MQISLHKCIFVRFICFVTQTHLTKKSIQFYPLLEYSLCYISVLTMRGIGINLFIKICKFVLIPNIILGDSNNEHMVDFNCGCIGVSVRTNRYQKTHYVYGTNELEGYTSSLFVYI